MLYIGNKLLILNDENMTLSSCTIYSSKQNEYEWKHHKLKLIKSSGIKFDFWRESKCIVAFNAILLIFHFESQNMWYCDLGNVNIDEIDNRI